MTQRKSPDALQAVAGNGLLHRRLFLTGGAAAAGLTFLTARAAPPDTPAWMKAPGTPLRAYGERSTHEAAVQRSVGATPGTTGTGSSRTPLEALEGIVTPSSLHFERHHSGVPEIDPDQHQVLIHGLVDRPLIFSMDALARYPLVSRIQFLECAGNSGGNNNAEAPQQTAGGIHGLLLALYQNGERIRPEQGYPVRLFLPGFEGNMNVKWLRRIKVTAEPTMTKDETSKYSDLQPNGRSLLFTFPMEVKSVITSPSGTQKMQGPGLYQISGLAWSGLGRIRRVEVSADGGKTWAQAALDGAVLPKAVTRFRMPWRWNGGPSVLQSRAIDETGAVQPSRPALMAARGAQFRYHYNAIQSWNVAAAGEVSNVYA
jgi:sulfane dehydrogenase subunit SoxC